MVALGYGFAHHDAEACDHAILFVNDAIEVWWRDVDDAAKGGCEDWVKNLHISAWGLGSNGKDGDFEAVVKNLALAEFNDWH